MKKLNWILLLTGLLTLFVQELFSCDCSYIGYGDKLTNLDFEIENSDFILTATIVEKLDSVYPAFYKITITKVWKGQINNIDILTTGTGGGDCGMLFEIGKEYIIYGRVSLFLIG
jgi:hypothetical protein